MDGEIAKIFMEIEAIRLLYQGSKHIDNEIKFKLDAKLEDMLKQKSDLKPAIPEQKSEPYSKSDLELRLEVHLKA